jgi:teichuronic acid biosynthesis glycosyltransferase TuaG
MERNISIIVVTYNRLNYLKLTVESILLQTFNFTELLIVCDGYQQDVKDYILTLNDPRITYHNVDHCGYPAKARNLGIERSTGNYIAFCDDDDVWLTNKLEKQMAVFDNNTSIGLCCTNRDIINSYGVGIEIHTLKWIPAKCNLSNLLLSNYITYSSVVIKRAILEKSGIFIDDIRFKAIEDYHLWLRIAFYTEIYFLNEPLILYRMHGTNISDKLSDGAQKNMQLYSDLFSKYQFKLSDKLKAHFIVYSKYLTYKLMGK